jgi:nitrogen fixation/metabolism regulation signal transduction histidine kinase
MPEGQKCILTINTFLFEFTNAKYAGIEIADNGPGFPKDVLGRAFDPYMTTKLKGNGLGLAIVKKIVEEHNGVIRATNQKQGGAAINIRFPLYDYGVKKNKKIMRAETR